jgi:2'-5' RNA ligase
MRLFTAIELPEDVRAHLAKLVGYWREHLNDALYVKLGYDAPPVKWVDDENLHITLKFLGEVPDADFPSVRKLLAEVALPEPMRIRVNQVDCLPNRGPVRIIAAGLDGDVQSLAQLHKLIERACADFGIAEERREFHPHITLGRLRIPLPNDARKLLGDIAARHLPGPAFEASGFALIQSVLLPQGPQYRCVARVASFEPRG